MNHIIGKVRNILMLGSAIAFTSMSAVSTSMAQSGSVSGCPAFYDTGTLDCLEVNVDNFVACSAGNCTVDGDYCCAYLVNKFVCVSNPNLVELQETLNQTNFPSSCSGGDVCLQQNIGSGSN